MKIKRANVNQVTDGPLAGWFFYFSSWLYWRTITIISLNWYLHKKRQNYKCSLLYKYFTYKKVRLIYLINDFTHSHITLSSVAGAFRLFWSIYELIKPQLIIHLAYVNQISAIAFFNYTYIISPNIIIEALLKIEKNLHLF